MSLHLSHAFHQEVVIGDHEDRLDRWCDFIALALQFDCQVFYYGEVYFKDLYDVFGDDDTKSHEINLGMDDFGALLELLDE